ncbi:MAG: DUF2723 domain-containing protein [Candidatus Levybacteria bacterium]|nr:DUF2723 domain-containing protein [Candidatus Levybacteria bacterium]
MPILVLLISLSVYLYTLSPTIMAGDNTEMVTAAAVLGIPHHSSYPVNTIIGYLFSRLPISAPLAWKINAAAAVMQALSVMVFYFLTVSLFELSHLNKMDIRHSGERKRIQNLDAGQASMTIFRLVAFSASLFFAFNLIFWNYGTKFEVFALNNLLVMLVLLVAVRLRIGYQKSLDSGVGRLRRPPQNDVILASDRRKRVQNLHWLFYLLLLLIGLAVSHHQTAVLVLPLVAYLCFPFFKAMLRNEIGIAKVLLIIFLGILPFFSIMYLASRNPPLNWGNPTTVEEALAALSRRDAGGLTPFVGFEEVAKYTPVDQVLFYSKFIIFDFTVVGVAIGLIGLIGLYRTNRKIFLVVLGSFLISGFLFLSYANFPLTESFNQATVRRFHMLPNIFIGLFIAFGLLNIYKFIERSNVHPGNVHLGGAHAVTPQVGNENPGVGDGVGSTTKNIAVAFGKLCIVFLFVIPLAINFSKANHRDYALTEDYTIQSYSDTEDNALILVSGDIPLMTVNYFRYVEKKNKDHRIAFSPGQFHLPWDIPQLVSRNPDLVIPSPRPGKRFTTATQVIDANWGKRPIYVNPDLVSKDPELDQKYVLWPKNLLFLVKKKGEDLRLEEFRDENDKLWKKIDIDLMQKIKRNPPQLEESIVFYYTRHFFNVGFVFEEVKLYDGAIVQYKRVLQIDPFFKEALAALGRVYGEKKDPPDLPTGIDYLKKYQTTLTKDEGELWQAAENTIEYFQQKAVEDLQRQLKEEATKSAVASEAAR